MFAKGGTHEGGHGVESAGGTVQRPPHPASREYRHALHVSKREAFLLRLDPKVLDALRRWAADDLRSVNAQVEFLLRRALRDEGRLRRARGKKKP